MASKKKRNKKFSEVQKTRLRRARALVDGSVYVDVAKKMGVSSASITNYVGRTARPMGEKFAEKLEKAFDKEPGWLSYDGPAISVTGAPDIVPRKLPLIGMVQAGEWSDANNMYALGDAEGMYYTHKQCGPHSYFLRVVGDSMWNHAGRPSYADGDLIIVDPDQAGDAANGSNVIARLLDESLSMDRRVVFKRLVIDGPRIYLVPLNKDYEAILEEFEVIGLVLGGYY